MVPLGAVCKNLHTSSSKRSGRWLATGGGIVRRLLSTSRHTSFYGRPLPAGLLSFSSTEGKQVFVEALQAGYLEAYFPLAAQFITQVHHTHLTINASPHH